MPTPLKKIRLMISSQCETLIDFKGKKEKLTAVRRELKKELETFKLPNQTDSLFECWINEDAVGSPGSKNWWQHCIKQAEEADIVIVLYTGAAGGGLGSSDTGICHQELLAGMDIAADRIRVVKLPNSLPSTDSLQQKRDASFQKYFGSLGHFRATAKDGDEVITKAWLEINKALIDLLHRGAISTHISQSSSGQALDWQRMNYEARKRSMEEVIVQSLISQPGAKQLKVGVIVRIGSGEIFVKPHATPASLSLAASREKVGQPFLSDHELFHELKTTKAGPIHIIASPKGVTESHALKMLGFPDATVVSDSFGVHIADNVQKIQIVLLKNCVSPSALRRQLTDWFDWLRRTKEDALVLQRAQARFRIVEAITKEVKT